MKFEIKNNDHRPRVIKGHRLEPGEKKEIAIYKCEAKELGHKLSVKRIVPEPKKEKEKEEKQVGEEIEEKEIKNQGD